VGSLAFSVLCVPYVVLTAAFLFLAAITLVIRGDAVLRLSLLVSCAVGLPWSLSFLLVGCTEDPVFAEHVYRIGYGGASLVGPALMMLVLGVSGRYDSSRALVGLGFVVALASSIVCWSTNWVVRGVHETPSGLFYITPGWYQLLHVLQIPLWGGLGVLLSRRGMRATRDPRFSGQRRRAIWVVVLSVTTLMDSLLAHRIAGYYPIAWLAILGAIGLASYSILFADLLKGRGVDRAALVELAALVLIFAFLVVVTWGGNQPWLARPVVSAVFLAPLPTLAMVAAWTMRIRTRRLERAGDAAAGTLDRFADEVRDLEDEAAVAARLGAVLSAHAPIGRLRVWAFDEHGEARALHVDDVRPPRIDARVRAWLVANLEPMVTAELTSARLGGLRSLIEDAVGRIGGDLILPLVDRDTLVGIAAGELPPYRVLRDDERDFVRAAATTAARGLTFLALTREASHLASTAREVELAEAVAQARATGDIVLAAGSWKLLGHYRPAARVAGDVWSSAELGRGRVLVFAGDVVGRGVPSALVSAAVGGVCDAAPALTGGAIEPRGLLELVHKTVRELGGGTQRVTAFAAILDRGVGTIRWACAGHRGAYLVHPPPPDADEPRARLELLGARSTPLGEPVLVIAEGEKHLGPGDHVVAASDGVVEVRDIRGEPWGERRLQRILRDQLLGAGDRGARMIVAAAVAHAGDAPIGDDMLVVVARPTATPD